MKSERPFDPDRVRDISVAVYKRRPGRRRHATDAGQGPRRRHKTARTGRQLGRAYPLLHGATGCGWPCWARWLSWR